MYKQVQKGVLAELWVTTHLLSLGFNVARPLVDNGSDLWVETSQGVLRVQVKTARWTHKGDGRQYRWKIESGGNHLYGTRMKTTKTLADYQQCVELVVAVSIDREHCWIFPPSAFGDSRCSYLLKKEDLNRWDRFGTPRGETEETPQTVEQMVLQWNLDK